MPRNFQENIPSNIPKKPRCKRMMNKHHNFLLSEELFINAFKAGYRAATKGTQPYTKIFLIEIKQYSEEEADAYIDGYNNYLATAKEQSIKRAKSAGRSSALQGCQLPSDSVLEIEYHYTPEEVEAYKTAYSGAALDAHQQALRKARAAGRHAAISGFQLPNIEVLMARNAYTIDQANVYIEAYQEYKGTPEVQLLRRARIAGQRAASRNTPLLPKECIIQRNEYTEAQALAYIESYNQSNRKRKILSDSHNFSVEEQIAHSIEMLGEDIQLALVDATQSDMLESITSKEPISLSETELKSRVYAAASKLARTGGVCPTKEKLTMKGKYTVDEADLYLKIYQFCVKDIKDSDIRLARANAQNEASRGHLCPPQEELLQKYNPEQVKAYIEAFTAAAANLEAPHLRKAFRAGQQAARHGVDLISKDAIKSKKRYTDEEVESYIKGFNQSKPSTEAQKLIKARRSGQGAALSGTEMASQEVLKARGYSTEQINAYIEAYQLSAGNDQQQQLRKARTAGRNAASKHKFDIHKMLSLESLQKEHQYSVEEANAYIDAYQKSVQRQTPILVEVQLQPQEIEASNVNQDPLAILANLLSEPSTELLTINQEVMMLETQSLLQWFDNIDVQSSKVSFTTNQTIIESHHSNSFNSRSVKVLG